MAAEPAYGTHSKLLPVIKLIVEVFDMSRTFTLISVRSGIVFSCV